LRQTRIGSAVEQVVSTAIGFVIAFIANLIVLPLFGYPMTVGDGAAIGVIFTIISVVRGYWVRRLFNRLKFGHAEGATHG
jgi:uncharacterized protein YacL